MDGRAARRPGGRVTGRESRDTAGFALPVSLLLIGRANTLDVYTA